MFLVSVKYMLDKGGAAEVGQPLLLIADEAPMLAEPVPIRPGTNSPSQKQARGEWPATKIT